MQGIFLKITIVAAIMAVQSGCTVVSEESPDQKGTDMPLPTGYLACVEDEGATGPRSEHPRPDFCRRKWQNLNGEWAFAFDPDDTGISDGWGLEKEKYDRSIQVPFSWQSELSGLHETEYEGLAWYARSFTVPEDWRGERVHLIFGAVDWESILWVNGQKLGEFVNGYLPLRVDITDVLVGGENEIVLRVFDPGNHAEYPHGKQGDPWYTNVGGIWQTVYLEAVPSVSIERFHVMHPESLDEDPLQFDMEITYSGSPCSSPRLYVWREGDDAALELAGVKSAEAVITATVNADRSWVWSPDEPNLIALTIYLCTRNACDAVSTCVGLRTVSRAHVDGLANQLIHLNGEAVFFRAPLVQGYHPRGLMTYPDEQTIIDDLSAAKEMGFNAVRLHIKPEEPRVLHHADSLGLMVDYDMVNLGDFPIEAGDTEAGRERWLDMAERQMLRDRNHPSVIWWTLFNETWGLTGVGDSYNEERQGWVSEMLDRARELGPSMLFEDMSPTYWARDHVETDLMTWHFYISGYDDVAAHLDEVIENSVVGSDFFYTGGGTQPEAYPLINTEFGPFSYEPITPDWKRDRDVSNAFRWMVQEFRKRPEISGYIFTELYDVEFEHNGLYDYDRSPKEDGYRDLMDCGISGLQQEHFIGIEEGPSLLVGPGTEIELHPWISTYRPDIVPGAADWELVNPALEAGAVAYGTLDIPAVAIGKTGLDAVQFTVPTVPGAYVWRVKAASACNYLPLIVMPERTSGWEQTDNGWAYTLQPGDLGPPLTGQLSWPDVIEVDGAVEANGFLEYGMLRTSIQFTLVQMGGTWRSAKLGFEAAANERGMPQTDAVKFPTDVGVYLDEIKIADVHYEDDWADARGILSHHYISTSEPTGAYGEWTEISIEGELLSQVAAAAEDGELVLQFVVEGRGGFILYGMKLGRFPNDPVFEFQVEN